MIIISKHATIITDKVDDDDEIREALAAIQYEIWAHWMEYLFSVCTDLTDGCKVIPAGLVTHWSRQVVTSYDELPETEKDSDRSQADKVMAFLYGQWTKKETP